MQVIAGKNYQNKQNVPLSQFHKAV